MASTSIPSKTTGCQENLKVSDPLVIRLCPFSDSLNIVHLIQFGLDTDDKHAKRNRHRKTNTDLSWREPSDS